MRTFFHPALGLQSPHLVLSLSKGEGGTPFCAGTFAAPYSAASRAAWAAASMRSPSSGVTAPFSAVIRA